MKDEYKSSEAPIAQKEFEAVLKDVLENPGDINLYFDKSKIITKKENGKLFVRCQINDNVWWPEIDEEAWNDNELKFVR